MNETPKLQIKTLGGFAMYYNGNPLAGNFREKSQFTLLMQTILHNRETGVSRELMEETLIGDREVDDIAHSIRSCLYTTKQKLLELGLPDVKFFKKQKNTWYWTDEIEVEEDAVAFELSFRRAVQTQDLQTRFEGMMQAIPLYTGSFLPHMKGINWIEGEAKRLRTLFYGAMHEIENYALQNRKYEELYEAAHIAAKADPYARWEILEMRALVAMDQYEAAERLFNETVDLYVKKFGSVTAKDAREVIHDLGTYMMYQHADLDGITSRLKVKEIGRSGGYYCPFPIFRDIYRNISRVMMRTGEYVYLMLCTILDEEGNPMVEGTELERLSELLLDTLLHSVRYSDTITRYGKGQFLVLLYGTNKENCSIIQKRIEERFSEKGMAAGLRYEIEKMIMDE